MNFDIRPQENEPAPVAERRSSRFSRYEGALRAFSPGERLLLYALIAVLAVSAFALLVRANALVSTETPSSGGALTEGVTGSARFINPLLALSGPDRDLTGLVYSGLMRATPEGTLIPDLAERYEISDDGTVYTFTLRDDLEFHDGKPVTSRDVVFTIQRAQNADIKSPHRADWEGVAVSSPDESTIVFTLPHAYAPFLENTTIGVLPAHVWEEVPVEEFPFHPLNTHPIGTGPYRIDNFDTNSTGAATRYTLSAFKKFALGNPFLRTISFVFYPNETALLEAYERGRVDSVAGISPAAMTDISRDDARIVNAALPRSFGVFLNQNKNPLLADLAVRRALEAAVDKERIVNNVFHGYAVPLENPVPPGILGDVAPAVPRELSKETELLPESDEHAANARAILERNDWTWSEENAAWTNDDDAVLQITLATADEPELAATAEAVAEDWRAAGIRADVHVYPLAELNTLVLRPRNYEALLFGEVVGRALDLFAFWHSSQRNDPGLNLALYTNSNVDRVLAEARIKTSAIEREELYGQFVQYVAEDTPAIFLYAPEFIYLVPHTIRGIELGALTTPAERFLNVYEWHTDTERIWNVFAN